MFIIFKFFRLFLIHLFCLLFSNYITRFLPRRWDDYLHSLRRFLRTHGRLPTSRNTFVDVIFRLKVSSALESPLCVLTTDKEYVKLYIKSVIGDEYNIPTFTILHNESDLRSYDFPPRCAIKLTNGSGEVVLKKDNDIVDLSKLSSWFSINHYNRSRERNYRTLSSRIIVEELVFNESNAEDIKFFCVGGVAKLIMCEFDIFGDDSNFEYGRRFYDIDFNDLNMSLTHPLSPKRMSRPVCLDKMIKAAEALSQPFYFVRIDMYVKNSKFYIGEITHVHGSAKNKFNTPEEEELINTILFG